MIFPRIADRAPPRSVLVNRMVNGNGGAAALPDARRRRAAHTEMIQAISALNLLLNLFLNSGAESMVQQE
jgi:hypothetical protein